MAARCSILVSREMKTKSNANSCAAIAEVQQAQTLSDLFQDWQDHARHAIRSRHLDWHAFSPYRLIAVIHLHPISVITHKEGKLRDKPRNTLFHNNIHISTKRIAQYPFLNFL